jgi:hypothetical protein
MQGSSLPYDRAPPYDRTSKIITAGMLVHEDCPIGVHMLPITEQLVKKIVFGIFYGFNR